MADWFRTNRGWLVPSFVITSTIILLFSYTLHMQNEKREQSDEIVTDKVAALFQPKKIPVPEPPRKHPVQETSKKNPAAPTKIQVTAKNPPMAPKQPVPVTNKEIKTAAPAQIASPVQVLPKQETKNSSEKSTPDELIQNLEGLTGENLNAQKQKLLGKHVIWPAYLFSAEKKGYDMFTVSFDSSRTGFGVVIVAEMDLLKYVNIVTSRQGDIVLIDGTITGIDVNGTGQINLRVDSIHPVDR
jgi:hypothetical protein